jgi:regulator of RNase E activity RraA
MDALTARLAKLYASAVHDVLRGLGHDACVLPEAIRPLDPARRLAGPVWTCSGHVDRTKTRHDTLLAWTTLLSRAPAGHVIVCQPDHDHIAVTDAPSRLERSGGSARERPIALMGELSAETLQRRGVLGYVVDGGCRDTDFVLELGFPVFHSFFTPSDITGRWMADIERFGQPITLGDVTICTGDYLLGDRDGVVVIPRAMAEDVIARTEEVAVTESMMRRALRGGMDPVDAYLKHGKF